MDKPQIVLPLKKGDPVTLTVSEPTVLAKRNYFRNGHAYNEHLLKATSLRIDRDTELKKLQDTEQAKTRADRDKIIEAAGKLNRELEKLNDKSYELDTRTCYDLLIPIEPESKKPSYEEIDWDNANDNELEAAKSFFDKLCNPTTPKSNGSEQTTNES